MKRIILLAGIATAIIALLVANGTLAKNVARMDFWTSILQKIKTT